MTPNIHYENREIEGERLELTDKKAIYWLGPNVTLRGCTLVTNISARWLHLVSGNLIDCTIHAKSQLKTLPWAPMKLKGCRFKGRFTGNEFGFRTDLDDRWKGGGIEDCDFSEALLHGCGFYNCDMSTIRLPRWPCFTFLDPLRHAAELRQHAWPGRFGRVSVEVVCESPKGTVAVTWHAPTVAEKMDTTVEELRAALERVPQVVM
ncbi:hypothetical protein JRI60_11515 [Archangium violaceum]|uniref:hypothetical protein n=1 Tax=Archangium violaceum TaxID=83451 RepID=UPI0019507FE2|nr:hypothetical protein [Archangium violaceum]QRN99600.1 hypothetical protein JRI60_11515 [Archangium violaceum]